MAYTVPAGASTDFDLTPGAQLQLPSSVDFDLALGPQASVLPSIVPGVIASLAMPWNRKAAVSDIHARALWSDAIQIKIAASFSASGTSSKPDKSLDARHKHAIELNARAAAPWGTPTPTQSGAIFTYKQTEIIDPTRTAVVWENTSVWLWSPITAPFLVVTPIKDTDRKARWRSSDVYKQRQNYTDPWIIPPFKWPNTQPINLFYQVGRQRLGHFNLQRGRGAPWTAPRDSFSVYPFAAADTIDQDKAIPWGPSGFRDTTLDTTYDIEPNAPTGGREPPIPAEEKEFYSEMNSINVTRTSDGLPLEMENVRIGLDADSWAWTFSAEVLGAGALALIQPGISGPIDIDVAINGHSWRFMIESYNGSRRFPGERFTVKGVSRTQLLAAPYADPTSGRITAATAATALITDRLFGTGFIIDWDASVTSWTVTADSYSWQEKTPIEIAREVADAIGAILVPAMTGDTLLLQPRLRVSPWDLATAVAAEFDAEIPMAMVRDSAMQFIPSTLYDSAYVSGTTHGQSALVELFGTGGVSPAPDVFSDLMSDTTPITERARQEIGNSGDRALYTLSMIVPESSAAPGILKPGDVVKVIENAADWRGYVLGTNIAAGRTGPDEIMQTVQIVRFYEH